MPTICYAVHMKMCARCGTSKPLDEFSKYSQSHDGKQAWCKACFKARYQITREHHVSMVTERKKQVTAENRQKMFEYFQTHHCTDCGIDDPLVLEFDHLQDKQYNVSSMMRDFVWVKILQEIAKCEVVCANCHRKRTYLRSGSWRLGV